jgi:endogenous inhibitor of DNA gyrase (YacG/DUF329 family)
MNKVTCPICGKPMSSQMSEWPDYPFCTPRCRKIDLGRWLGEEYRVKSTEAPSSPDDEN